MARKISTPRRSELPPVVIHQQAEKKDENRNVGKEAKAEDEEGEEINDDDAKSRSRQGTEEPKTNDDDSLSETSHQPEKANHSSLASTSFNSIAADSDKDMMDDDDDADEDEDDENETFVATAVKDADDDNPVSTDLTLSDATATAARLYKDDIAKQTFHILKHYLATFELLDVLNEEEVANRMMKNIKIATERVRFQGNVLWEKKADESEDDDDEEREKIFQEAYEQEETFGLANEFFKKIITELNEQLKLQPQQQQRPAAGSKKKSSSRASLPLVKLDKKAVNWLKRAMGLERNDDLWYLSASATTTTATKHRDIADEMAGDFDHPVTIPRFNQQRVTRGVARSTRIKRRQERTMRENIGIQGMLQAIDELEVEYGPFVYNKKLARRSAANESTANDDGNSKIGNKENQEPKGLIAHWPIVVEKSEEEEQRSLRPRKTLEQYRVVRLMRILVGRKHVRPIVMRADRVDEKQKKRKGVNEGENRSLHGSGSSPHRPPIRTRLPLLKKARLDHLYDVDSDVVDDDDEEDHENTDANDEPEGRLLAPINETELLEFSSLQRSSKDPMPLRLLDWQRRHSSSRREFQQFEEQQEKFSLIDPKIASIVQLPPIFTKTGVQYLPKWEDVKRLRDAQKPPNKYKDPPRVRYSDAEYAERCARLINSLSGPASAWARYEFFYSDIDRAWYTYNEFAADAAKLGVRPSMRFSRSEWSMIRRRIPNRPRLFSKRFIFSQLQKRNEYRDIARRAQVDLEVTTNNFDYPVTATIPVGATVTAFNKRYRVLQRGVVLFHDTKAKGYLVLFERRQLGYEFCPDTEVASHGVPRIILNSPSRALDGSSLGATFDHNSNPGNVPYGTLLHPPNGMQHAEDVSLSSKLMEIVTKPRSEMIATVKKRSVETHVDVNRKIEERAILGRLLNIIKHATTRKTMILDAIEKYHELDEEADEYSLKDPIFKNQEKRRQHYDWLLANLQTTNASLEAALVQMRVMYGKAYAAGISRNQEVEKRVFHSSKEALVRRLSWMDNSIRDLAQPWMYSVVMDCKDAGKQTATSVAAKEFGTSPGRQERHSYLQHRIASAIALLFTAAFCVDRFANENDGTTPVIDVQPVNDVFSCALEHLKLTVLPSDNSDSRVLEADASRWFEASELEEATKILYAELAACRAQQKVRGMNS